MAACRLFHFAQDVRPGTLPHWRPDPPHQDDPDVETVHYADLSRFEAEIPAGTYVFSDIDRLDAAQMRDAVRLAWRITAAGPGRFIANWPNRVLGKAELLAQEGQQRSDHVRSWHLVEHRPIERFPVVLQTDATDATPLTPPLHDRDAFLRAARDLIEAGVPRARILVTEHRPIDALDGRPLLYRAVCAFGGVQPVALACAAPWPAALFRPAADEIFAAAELVWHESNPHATRLARIFARAGVDWGSALFGTIGGAVQVFGIDTSPQLLALPVERAKAGDRMPPGIDIVSWALRRLCVPPDGYGAAWQGSAGRPRPAGA